VQQRALEGLEGLRQQQQHSSSSSSSSTSQTQQNVDAIRQGLSGREPSEALCVCAMCAEGTYTQLLQCRFLPTGKLSS
jgi:hypothetical protein